jgi:ABC-type transport system involved in cytochrome c biogenesis permease component
LGKMKSSGQVVALLIVPLILAVVILNLAAMEYVEKSNESIDELMGEYQIILDDYSYFQDPVTGNTYILEG